VADPGFETFGPLGATPAISIKLPTLPPVAGSPDRLPTAASATRVAGGVLVTIAADPESHTSNSSVLAAIGFDGTKRWVRCLDSELFGVWASPANPDTALVAATNEDFTFDYRVVSVATGEDVTTTDLKDLASFSVIAESPSRLLLGHTPAQGSVPDALRLYDLSTNKIETIALPSDVTDAQYLFFDFDDKDEPTVTPDFGSVTAVYRNGAWVTGAAVIDATAPPYVDFVSDKQVLTGHRATGSVLWSHAEFTSPGLETSAVEADGAITVVAVCTQTTDLSCQSYALAGVVTATGKVAWTLPGFRQLGAIGDGYALINDSSALDPNPGWILVDTRTGKQVADDQHWTESTLFQIGCCGDYSSWVRRFGGVVVAQSSDVLRVWLPRTATPAKEHTLSLP
jgi:hypothetical protein